MNAGHYLLGIEGLALMRTAITGPRARADACVREMRNLLQEPAGGPLALELDAPEEDVVRGYGRWASTYDGAPNPLIRIEEPVVRGLLDARPPGVALDAACGTGRHTRHLAARGHTVIGVDASPAMLAAARRAVPGADLRDGDLTALPLGPAGVDLAVCALALTHCPRLGPPVAELARVLRPGGTLVLSDLHPLATAIGMTGFFVAADGTAGVVRTYHHLHADYLDAFAAAGLVVRRCLEPRYEETDLDALSGGMLHLAPEAFSTGLVGFPGALVWELARS